MTSDDIEAEKRRKRAERFGIPLVEPKPAPTPRAKQQVKRETSTATAAVSEGEKRTPTVVTDVSSSTLLQENNIFFPFVKSLTSIILTECRKIKGTCRAFWH